MEKHEKMSDLFINSGFCRCCHAQGSFKSLNQTYIYEGRREIYSNMLQQTFNIEIKPGPTALDVYSICDMCIPRLRDAEQFRHQVATCEQLFYQYYNIHSHRGIESYDKEVKEEAEEKDVSRHTSNISEILPKLHTIWDTCCPDRKRNIPEDLDPPERRLELSPTFRNFEDDRAPTPQSDEEVVEVKEIKVIQVKEVKVSPPVETPSKQAQESESNGLLELFDRILCPRNIVLLSDTKVKASEVWEALADVLVFLLKNDYLTEDSLTEQCLAVYRQDWPQNILENLSTCMKSVSSRWSRSSTGKFTLFLDFLADYCNDMDYDLVE